MPRPDERFTPSEFEPDPQLYVSSGRASALHIVLVALGTAVFLGLMIYGLNQPVPEKFIASAPQSQTTGAAPQDQPAQRPLLPQAKPGAAGDDSKR